MKILSFAFLILLTSCLKGTEGPEGAVQDFIKGREGKVIDRDFVLERTTGKMLQSFENMSDEDFSKFADMSNIKTQSFKVLSKSCQDKKCFITYSVEYQTKKDNKVTVATEVKKIAEVIQVESRWLIADVSNIKTYHESFEPIEPLE